MIEIKVQEARNGIIIIKLDGDFSIESSREVEDIWDVQVAKQPRCIAIDCSDLKFIDSTAIGTLVRYLNIAMNKKIELIFFDLNPSIQSLFSTAKLDKFFSVTTKNRFETKYLI